MAQSNSSYQIGFPKNTTLYSWRMYNQ